MTDSLLVLCKDKTPLLSLLQQLEVGGYSVEVWTDVFAASRKIQEGVFCCLLVAPDWPHAEDTAAGLRQSGYVVLRLSENTKDIDAIPLSVPADALSSFVRLAIACQTIENANRDQNILYSSLLTHMEEGVLIVDPNEVIIYANPSAERLLGSGGTPGLVGQALKELTNPEQYKAIRAQTRRRMEGESSTYTIQFDLKDGSVRYMRVTASPLMDPKGGFKASLDILQDISGEVTSRQLVSSQRMLTDAFSNTAALLTSTLDINEVFDRILINVELVVPHPAANIMLIENDLAVIVRHRGYGEHGWGAMLDDTTVPLKDAPYLQKMIASGEGVFIPDTAVAKGWRLRDSSKWLRSYVGTPIHIKGEVIGFLNLDSDQPGYFKEGDTERLAVFADQAAIAIENARLYSEVQRLAVCDDLTGLFNRRGLFEYGNREIERAIREDKPIVLAWLDFDFFKRINDAFGHDIGDSVLQQTARLCRRSLRASDLIGRYGGDELVIVLPNTDIDTAFKVCDRLRGIIADTPFVAGDSEVHLTVSIGLAALRRGKPELGDMLNRSDHAMYSAKAAGHNCVFIDPL